MIFAAAGVTDAVRTERIASFDDYQSCVSAGRAMYPHQHGNACIGPASARKDGPLGQGPDQTYGDESDEASIEGKSNHNRNIGMEQLTCHHRNDRNRCERVTEALRQDRREYDDKLKDRSQGFSGACLGRSFPSDALSPSAISNERRTTMKEKKEAISGTVTGNDQHTGFRAMIMKQAIKYNLAGFTKNVPNDVVNFTLQGDAKRLTDAVSAIQEGTKKSSDINVRTAQGTVDPALNAFTIYAWTSMTRNITNPYNLVFHLRPDDGEIAPADVKTVWHGILQSTLKGDDLKKLGPDD